MKNFNSILSLFLVLNTMFVPRSVATISDADRAQVERGHNFLHNGGFENGKANWTASSSSTFTVSTTAAKPGEGSYGGIFTPTASGQTLIGEAITGAPGTNGQITLWTKVPTGTTTNTLGIWNGSSVGQSTSITSSSTWTDNTINFIFPASGTVAPIVTSSGSTFAATWIDKGYMGPAINIGMVVPDTNWTPFTPTGTWTSNTTYSGQYRQVGDSYDIQYFITLSGAPTATPLILNTPNGVTVDTTKLAYGATPSDNYSLTGSVRVLRSTVDTYGGQVMVNSTANGFEVFADKTSTGTNPVFVSTNAPVTNTSPNTMGSGDKITVNIYNVPIAGKSSAANQTVTVNQQVDYTGLWLPTDLASCPTNTLPANGQTISILNWPHYFAVKGLAGPTATLANMNALFPRGIGTQTVGGISYSGPSVGSTQADEMQGHYHSLQYFVGSGSTGTTNIPFSTTVNNNPTANQSSTNSVLGPISDGTNGTPRTGTENRPVNMGVNWCVVMTASFGMPMTTSAVTARANTTGVTTIDTTATVTASTYNSTDQIDTILANTASNNIAVTLPIINGKKFFITQTSSANGTTITPVSGTICGKSSIKLGGLNEGGAYQFDGTNYQGLIGSCTQIVGMTITQTGTTTFSSSALVGGAATANCSSTGTCGMTFVAPFSSVPVCSTVEAANEATRGPVQAGVSGTSMTFLTTDASGNLTNRTTSITCIGSR